MWCFKCSGYFHQWYLEYGLALDPDRLLFLRCAAGMLPLVFHFITSTTKKNTVSTSEARAAPGIYYAEIWRRLWCAVCRAIKQKFTSSKFAQSNKFQVEKNASEKTRYGAGGRRMSQKEYRIIAKTESKKKLDDIGSSEKRRKTNIRRLNQENGKKDYRRYEENRFWKRSSCLVISFWKKVAVSLSVFEKSSCLVWKK